MNQCPQHFAMPRVPNCENCVENPPRHVCDHAYEDGSPSVFERNDDGETVCRQCWEVVDSPEPREIASWWHGGQWSPLYAFASSGHVNSETLREARECLDYAATHDEHTVTDIRHLHALIRHLERGQQS